MVPRLTMCPESPFISITSRNGEVRQIPRRVRHHVRFYTPAPRPAETEAAEPPTDTDDFYDRLQRIWDRVLRFEDLGVIHSESDKFRYAYQLAEAELKELCLNRTTLHRYSKP